VFGTAGIQSIVTGLEGDGGIDIMTGGDDAEILIGGPGADKIYGNGGDDVMLGDHGNIAATETLVTIDSNVRTDGGDDIMTGDLGADIMMGGTGGDEISGGAGNNVMLGDHGTISRTASAGEKVFGTAGIQSIVTGLEGDGGIDIMTGGDDAEILIGGPGADKIYGNGGDDVMLGDHGDIAVTDMLVTIDSHVEFDGDVDIMTGDIGADIMIGGTGGDDMTGGAGSNVMLGDHGTISRTASAGEKVFGTAEIQSVVTSLEGDGGDDTITGGDDDDILIGGSGTDTISGNAGDDLIAGDNASLDTLNGDNAGNRYVTATGPVYLADGSVNVGGMMGYPGDAPFWFEFGIELNHLGIAGNDDINGGAGEDMIFGQDGNDNIDGDLDDDYIEGGSGTDTIYGGLGQDDIIGGSSNLFGFELAEERSDGSDTIFGGEGTDTGRNTVGYGKHANDADVILGDNGNIYRLVGPDGYLKYGYDTYVEIRRLIPRVAKLLDYTPGGPDYVSAASVDIGDADTIHGEAGDDTIYGMKGNDILYGEAGDDDIIGGWGHDWISGGTGDDGVLGDDGRIYTSRNGIEEPLYGIGLNAELYIEGTKSMTATIYKSGEINKTVNLYPFNVDDMKDPFYDPQHADDIIYGGLGNDFLHGGSGDDAISGAEALAEFYMAPLNIGNVLGYNATTTLFAAYNPKAPMARVMVDKNGKFVLTGGTEFLMNFNANELDGNDMIFGDLGNDWLVGGPGMDWMFGGFGDDLLNADDDHNPLTDNTEVDFAPTGNPTYYDDILFGGGGRDILIASSTGDVMVDWTGEYNSYVVPTSNFGPGTVIRYSTKDIVKFLYDLSEGAGVDTDAGTYITGTDPARNSEPYGEIGLVVSGDPFDKDLSGAPRDPQPGNKGGKK
ncbi:calcium-binding protein, partial [Youngiibacter multivorans]|nr:Ca2+-binding RTX toxin-like protein [Youngiibacter multivorans]